MIEQCAPSSFIVRILYYIFDERSHSSNSLPWTLLLSSIKRIQNPFSQYSSRTSRKNEAENGEIEAENEEERGKKNQVEKAKVEETDTKREITKESESLQKKTEENIGNF